MRTRLTALLGIKYPIIQGAMAWTSDANLAAAVSNGGGAGIIAAGGRTSEWVRDEIRKAKALTDKPFVQKPRVEQKGKSWLDLDVQYA